MTHYGLDYINLDPLFFAPFPDGSHITIWKDVDKTCESIAYVSPSDAEAYRRFIDKWQPVAQAMVDSFLHPPTPFNLAGYMVFGSSLGSISRFSQLADLLHGYGQVMRQTFSSEQVQALISWMAAQSGPPPSEPFSAPFALWHPMYHVSGMKRPRGGSGMLTQALARMIEAHGGQIMTDAPVKRILIEKGRVIGAETEAGQQVTARVVVSGAHIHTTMKLLVENIPNPARTLLERSRIGNGFGMIVRYAIDELPNYTAFPSPADGSPGSQHFALQLICPDLAYLERAYADYLAGSPSRQPGLISMTFSAADTTLAPAGKHTLYLWG